MFNAADDDDFFIPTASTSNLTNLFNLSNTSNDASLTYTAPKQPSTSSSTQSSKKAQNVLICMKTIQLHRLVDSTYVSIGKYGIAIIGDPALDSYDLIIYKTKQHIISTTKLTLSFKYTQHKDDVASFRDDQNQSWLLYFNDSTDCLEFAKELKNRDINFEYKEETIDNQDSQKVIMMAEKPEEEVINNGAQTRANILERISKVGQSMMLPNTNSNIDLSESEAEEVIRTKKIVRKPKRHSISDKEMIGADITEIQPQIMVPVSTTTQQYSLVNGQYLPNYSMMLNDPLHIFFAENRTHNSEVRMNLAQLTNKLESVLGEMKKPNETEQLKQKIDDLEAKIEALSKPHNAWEEKCAEFELQVTDQESTIKSLNDEIEQKTGAFDALKLELTARNNEFEAVSNDLTTHKQQFDDLTILHNKSIEMYNEKLAEFNDLQHNNDELLQQLQEQNAKLVKYEQYFKKNSNSEEKVKVFTDVVKECMNGMYQNILEKFDNTLTLSDFKKNLSQNMKSATFQIIEAYKQSVAVEFDVSDNPPPVPEFEVTV